MIYATTTQGHQIHAAGEDPDHITLHVFDVRDHDVYLLSIPQAKELIKSLENAVAS